MDFLHAIVKGYRGEEFEAGDNELIQKAFPDGQYTDVKGLCKVASLAEIEEQGWSLNPGRYVGVVDEEDDGVDFHERLSELNSELENLNAEAREIEKHQQIHKHRKKIKESPHHILLVGFFCREIFRVIDQSRVVVSFWKEVAHSHA